MLPLFLTLLPLPPPATLQYKNLLPGKIRQVVTFVDFAPLFRELADERLRRQYVLHEAQIKPVRGRALGREGGSSLMWVRLESHWQYS